MKTIGVVLAGGKGKRFQAVGYNKTAQMFVDKPLVAYGVELYREMADRIVVVVGDQAQSVKSALVKYPEVVFAMQRRRLGTGNALKTAITEIERKKLEPEVLMLGYGDHMMRYSLPTALELVRRLGEPNVAIAMVVTEYAEPTKLAWGRVLKSGDGSISGIVEQKDANNEQLLITHLNAGFYAFKYNLVKEWVKKLKKSPASGEYYATDLIEIAIAKGYKVAGVDVPFSEVGFGGNTREELQRTLEHE